MNKILFLAQDFIVYGCIYQQKILSMVKRAIMKTMELGCHGEPGSICGRKDLRSNSKSQQVFCRQTREERTYQAVGAMQKEKPWKTIVIQLYWNTKYMVGGDTAGQSSQACLLLYHVFSLNLVESDREILNVRIIESNIWQADWQNVGLTGGRKQGINSYEVMANVEELTGYGRSQRKRKKGP